MGFDLHGQHPSSCDIPEPDWDNGYTKEEAREYWALRTTIPGAYFRANVWAWRPLWDFVVKVCCDILNEEDIERGSFNDGHLISKRKAKRIAQILKKQINRDKHKQFAEWQEEMHKNLPLEKCKICDGKGTRKGWEGWQSEEDWLELHGSLDVGGHESACEITFKSAHDNRGCNACKGKGKTESFMTNYKFHPELLEEFESFCRLSGGFTIN